MINTVAELATLSARSLERSPASLREELGLRILIEAHDGHDLAARIGATWPHIAASFLDVVARWSVLGKSFTGFIDLASAERIGEGNELARLPTEDFISIGHNGSGDPIGVAPGNSTLFASGAIVHLNHDTDAIAVIAPDLETFLVGLGNFAEAWIRGRMDPGLDVDATTQSSLQELGWPEELRRFWPGRNESGCF